MADTTPSTPRGTAPSGTTSGVNPNVQSTGQAPEGNMPQDLSSLKKPELKEEAERRGVDIDKGATKDEIVEAITKSKEKRIPIPVEEQLNTQEDDAKAMESRRLITPEEQIASDE